MAKQSTLHTKIEGEHVSVKVTFETVEDSHICLRVANRMDALIACFCYKGQHAKIEKPADGNGCLVIIYKQAA